MKLSIGQAWDEAKRVLRADGGAIIAVALALMVLPGAVLETVSPPSLRPSGQSQSLPLSLAGLATALLSLAAQIGISRITLGPSITVGGALALAFRRLPALLAALLMLVVPFAVLVASLVLATGGDLQQPNKMSPGVALMVTLVSLIALYAFMRLLFLTPLAASTRLGPVALIKEGWRLTRGQLGRLILLLLALALVAVVLVIGLGDALGAVIILLLGPVAPGNVSAVLVALVQQALAASVSVLFVMVVSRLYAQAAHAAAPVSVPHAGSE